MRMFKKTLLSTAVAGSLVAGSMVAAPAMAGVSMNVGVTNNYLWRGMTQTSDAPAVQGGIDYAHDSGFYAGTWASNVNWTADNEGNTVDGYEIDFYLGYGGEFAEDWAYDVGYVYYMYPMDGAKVTPTYDEKSENDFGEIYGSLGWKGLTLFGAYQTNEEWDEDNDYYYVSLDYLFEYGDGMSSDFLIGYYGGDGVEAWNNGDALIHYYADVTKSTDYGDVTLALSIADAESFDGTVDANNMDDPRVVISWSKEF